MKYIHIFSALFSVFLSLSLHAYSPDRPAPTWWVNLGAGVGSTIDMHPSNVNGSAGSISFNGALSPKTFLTFSKGHIGGNDYYEVDELYDTSLLYGYINRKPKGYWSISSGISFYRIEQSYRYNNYYYLHNEEDRGIGLPIEIQAFWTPFNHFGIGFIGHAVASDHSYAKALLGFQIFF